MKEKLRVGLPFFGFFFCPVFTFILTELYTHNPFVSMRWPALLLNFIFYWFAAAFFFMLTGRLRAALMTETIFFMLAGLANYYVIAFRSSPILPWDIFSLKTAASVADNFSYALPGKVWLVLAGFALLLVMEWFLKADCKNLKIRLSGLVISVLLIMGLTSLLHQDAFIRKMRLYDKLFTPDTMQRKDGCAIAFLMELKFLIVEKPAGYQDSEARRLLASFEEGTKEEEEGKNPNIIVVMNEAFSDMGDVGEFTCNEDYMPFIHSLQEGAENTITGNLHVSVLGGNTANTEFEFLTGNTTAFLPQGSVAYQQYITGALPSLPGQLKQRGYETVAMHPYHATGWNRDKVYEYMDFDRQEFLESYQGAEYIRKYVSDKSCFDKIIEAYEKKEAGKPLFVFNVTMQNHGSYGQDFEDFTPDIVPEGINSMLLSKYLSLIRITDDAFRDFIEYFEEADEDTIIVFFGDHQPSDSIASPIWKYNGTSKDKLSQEEEALRYQVPFVIWANFDIEEENGVETSCNYLAGRVLEQAGVPLSGYQRYLRGLEKEYPIITAFQVVDSQGNVKKAEDTKQSGELDTYRQLQYYNMFDWKKSDGNGTDK